MAEIHPPPPSQVIQFLASPDPSPIIIFISPRFEKAFWEFQGSRFQWPLKGMTSAGRWLEKMSFHDSILLSNIGRSPHPPT